MAISTQQIIDFLASNPTNQQIAEAMVTFKVSPEQIAGALAEQVANVGTTSTVVENAETGQTSQVLNDLGGGFNAYRDENGNLSYSRVDPANPDKIQLYGSQGEYRGEEKVSTGTSDLIKYLGPIALAAGGSALVQSLLGGAATGATGAGLEFAGSGGAFDLANAGITGGTASFTAAELAAIEAAQLANFELLNAGAGAFTPTLLPPVNTTPLITPTPIVPPVVAPPVVTPPVVTPPPVAPPVVTTPPVVPPVVTTPTVIPPIIPPTITELVKTLAPIAIPAIVATAVTPKTTTPTGFDIVPIPTDWKTPNKPTTAPFTALSPINFGTQNLLRGTQFERLLDPNYGQVPEPVQYSQPSNLSYNDLMSILGSRQGMPSASSLSINDIISGIQNQYGQTPTRTMG
jgi:hypothetical protein